VCRIGSTSLHEHISPGFWFYGSITGSECAGDALVAFSILSRRMPASQRGEFGLTYRIDTLVRRRSPPATFLLRSDWLHFWLRAPILETGLSILRAGRDPAVSRAVGKCLAASWVRFVIGVARVPFLPRVSSLDWPLKPQTALEFDYLASGRRSPPRRLRKVGSFRNLTHKQNQTIKVSGARARCRVGRSPASIADSASGFVS
jgi:hypothetical protein